MIAGLVARIRSLFHGVRQDVDAEMQAEFAHHLDLRTRDLVAAGLSPADAARRARVEFGGGYDHRQAGREARGLRWFDAFRVSWLDIKLGARMIQRYPGLTVVGGLAMGVAIAIGAGVLGIIASMNNPTLPLHEGDRVVGLQVWSMQSFNAERRISYDIAAWKSELTTVRDIGAFRSTVRAVGAGDGRAEPARGTEMSASGFRVARVTPLLGRYLLEEDERPGAPLVAVLGYEIWSGRFASDSTIIGKSVRIGGVPHTVVGVMPRGFAWPINYNLWLPLRLDANPVPREGPRLYAFARLAPGASLEEAQTEIAALGDRVAATSPKTHQRLRARIMPFAQSWFELDNPEPETVLVQRGAQVAVTLLLLIICVNIAILVYARTATRQGEIAVRSALGASRSRIVAQLVGEAMVLAGIGAAVALAIIALIASRMDKILAETGAAGILPFWFTVGVSPATIGFLIGLAALAALIIGAIPALQVTGPRVQSSLQRLAGGHASVRMGKVWTSLVIIEVAMTVAILPFTAFLTSKTLEARMAGHGFPAEEILMAELSVNRAQDEAGAGEDNSLFTRRATELRYEVMRRLEGEPSVAGVSFAAGIPGLERSGQIEIEGVPVRLERESTGDGREWARWGTGAQRIRIAAVDVAFFDALEVAPIVGRTFRPGDAAANANVAVVNRTFADSLFGGGNPVGRKFRELRNPLAKTADDPRGPWVEIVGVVPDIPAIIDHELPRGVWYAPTRDVEPAMLLIHVRGADPTVFAARLRTIVSEVDDGMFVRRVNRLDEGLWATHMPIRLMSTALVAIALSVLFLSAAGLYALMSVIVTQRRREIAIRLALGANQRRVLTGIFARVALQVGTGIAVGLAIATGVLWAGGDDLRGYIVIAPLAGWAFLLVLPAVGLFMLAVGAVAALGPARRGLAIQPSTVLKEY